MQVNVGMDQFIFCIAHIKMLNLLQKSKGLTEICESNKYTIQFILKMADLKRAKSSKQSIENSSESEAESETSEIIENMELEAKWDDSD